MYEGGGVAWQILCDILLYFNFYLYLCFQPHNVIEDQPSIILLPLANTHKHTLTRTAISVIYPANKHFLTMQS